MYSKMHFFPLKLVLNTYCSSNVTKVYLYSTSTCYDLQREYLEIDLNLDQTKRGGEIITCEQKMVLKYLMSLIPRHHYGKIAVA